MRHITPRHMIGFYGELNKEAAVSDFLRSAGRFARSNIGKAVGMAGSELRGNYGRQVLLGTGLGAVGGALASDPDQPGGYTRGALKGALVGGGIAGGTVLARKKGREAVRKGIGNFYQRQRYSLTGKGLGKTEAEKLEKAREIGLIGRFDPETFNAKNFGGNVAKSDKASAAAKARIAFEEDALKKGYMSAPGVVHGMLTRPGDVIRSGWQRGGGPGKLFAGLGAYEAGKGLVEKPEEGGPGRLEKGLRGAGSALGWMVAPTTILGGQIVGMGGGYIGGKVGRLGDKGVQMVRRPGQVAGQEAY